MQTTLTFLCVGLALSCLGNVQPWAPCGSLALNQCTLSNFMSLSGTTAMQEPGFAATGQWSVANLSLIETSRSRSASSSACLGELGVMRQIDHSVAGLFQIRVKVRITAASGSAGIVFSDKDVDRTYYRFQLNAGVNGCTSPGNLVYRTGSGTTFQKTADVGGSDLARTNNWYELRLRVLFASMDVGRVELQVIDQTPPPGPVSRVIATVLDQPTIVVGTRIALWCAASGSSGGCEFSNFVIVQDSLRGSLTGKLDCQSCNLNWPSGSADWCRCCQAPDGCAPFERSGCVRDGMCTTKCMTSQWCSSSTSTSSPTTSTSTASTTSTTPSSTTTNRAPSTPAPVTTSNPQSTTATTTSASTSNGGNTSNRSDTTTSTFASSSSSSLTSTSTSTSTSSLIPSSSESGVQVVTSGGSSRSSSPFRFLCSLFQA
jgi:hypothetical protein